MEPKSQIHTLVKKNDIRGIVRAVKIKRLSPNNTDYTTGNAPLHIAAEDGNIDAIKCLLGLGALPSIRNKKNETPLHKAISAEIVECALRLLQQGASPHHKTTKGLSPLHIATLKKNVPLTKLLLKYGAHTHTRDNQKRTALEIAVSQKDYDLIRLLGSNSEIRDIETCRKSLPKKTPNSIRTFFSNMDTMIAKLFDAIKDQKHLDIGKIMAHGIPINVQDEYGNTPLHYATLCNDFATMYTLLIHGADPTITNNENRNPISCIFDQASFSSDQDSSSTGNVLRTVEFFIKASSVTSSQLRRTVYLSKKSNLKKLIAYSKRILANKNVRTGHTVLRANPFYLCDAYGNTILHISALCCSPKIVKMLLEKKLDPRTKNHRELSALDYAQIQSKQASSPTNKKIYFILKKAARELNLSDPNFSSETECCCICRKKLSYNTRIYLAPCGHNNICRCCARTNFFPKEDWERHYLYRQVCPLCKTPVNLMDLNERLLDQPL